MTLAGMTPAGGLLAATLATPLLLVALCLLPAFRRRVFGLLPLAPLPALVAALAAPGGSLLLAPAPMRLVLALDMPGALLLGGAALLWAMAGLYARVYMAVDPARTGFAVWWLLTLTGSLGVFVVADMTSFYLMFSLVSLAAYGLVAHAATPRALNAGLVYMALAVLGEALLLFGFVLLATAGPAGNPLIADAVAALPASPWRDATLALLILGFGLKMGLVPLHVWMPLAHPVAPMPASAVLSGIVVKAGVIGLIRFLPFDQPGGEAAVVLIAAGLFTAYYGVVLGLTQTEAKTILAYSTVSQMGLVAAILGAGLSQGDGTVATLTAYYALHHMLVKGALFMGVGVVAVTGPRYRRAVMAVMALMALSLAGLPLTSGALAKYAAKGVLGEGVAGALAVLSAAGSALLMLHFLRRIGTMSPAPAEADAPLGLRAPWLATAAGSLLGGWLLFAAVTGEAPAKTLAPAALWSATWPLLLGGLLSYGLIRRQVRLPEVPEGDIAARAVRVLPAFGRVGEGVERLDAQLRRWPVAGLALLAIVLALGAALAGAF